MIAIIFIAEYIEKRKDKKTQKYSIFYPLSYKIYATILKKMPLRKFNQKLNSLFKSLYVREKVEEKQQQFYCNSIRNLILVLVVVNFFSILIYTSKESTLINSYFVKRPDYGKSSSQVELNVAIDKKQQKKNLSFEVKEKQYTDKEKIEELFTEVEQYIDEQVLGSNESAAHVTCPLNLVKKVKNNPVTIKWKLDEEGIIGSDGSIYSEEIDDHGKVVTIYASLEYYDAQVIYPVSVYVIPEKKKKKTIVEEIKEQIYQSQSNDKEGGYLKLPEQVQGHTISYEEPRSREYGILFIFAFIIAGYLTYIGYYQLILKEKKRQQQLLQLYPDLINKLTLLVSAGMTVKNAWNKMCMEYEQYHKEKQYIYEEMIVTNIELLNGISEIDAYDRFGKRLKLVPYLKLSTLLVQNIKKGNSELLNLLEYEAIQAFEERKENAKRLGEVASTKLLAPMILMLFIVLFIIMVPAFMQM